MLAREPVLRVDLGGQQAILSAAKRRVVSRIVSAISPIAKSARVPTLLSLRRARPESRRPIEQGADARAPRSSPAAALRRRSPARRRGGRGGSAVSGRVAPRWQVEQVTRGCSPAPVRGWRQISALRRRTMRIMPRATFLCGLASEAKSSWFSGALPGRHGRRCSARRARANPTIVASQRLRADIRRQHLRVGDALGPDEFCCCGGGGAGCASTDAAASAAEPSKAKKRGASLRPRNYCNGDRPPAVSARPAGLNKLHLAPMCSAHPKAGAFTSWPARPPTRSSSFPTPARRWAASRAPWPAPAPPSSARPRSPPRSSAPASRPRRSRRSSWAACCRPASARPWRARPRSAPACPARSRRRRSTRCAARACRRRSSPTTCSPSARPTSSSPAAWSRCPTRLI